MIGKTNMVFINQTKIDSRGEYEKKSIFLTEMHRTFVRETES